LGMGWIIKYYLDEPRIQRANVCVGRHTELEYLAPISATTVQQRAVLHTSK
jgi:hypothetical protein